MPAPFQPQVYEIVLDALSSDFDSKTQQPGKLRWAKNVTFPKEGRVAKRRGYAVVNTTTDQTGVIMEALFCRVGQYEDELMLFGLDFLWSVESKNGSLAGSTGCVKRGPLPRGNVSFEFVASSGEAR